MASWRRRELVLALLGSALSVTAWAKSGRLPLGINIAGAEFAEIGGQWHWPELSNLRYYLDAGFRIFRVPFRWERLQPDLTGPLNEHAMAGLDAIVDTATRRGSVVVLDAHNYGRRHGAVIGAAGSVVGQADFADFWGRMAARYRSNGAVWYGLMNEPHDEDPTVNLAVQNAACRAIRSAGASARVLFSGIAWTAAHSWTTCSNGRTMLGAADAANSYAFEMHQYLDEGLGGAKPEPVPGIGHRVLESAYEWARLNGVKIFLGEFASGPSSASLTELDALVRYMIERTDVFIGATYFAGGGVWGRNNIVSTDPVDGERPQTRLLRSYIATQRIIWRKGGWR